MGTIIEFNDLKAPDPVEGKPPWQDPQWLARFEPALLVALAGWHPDRFVAPIAVDLHRAWSLTRDGGVTLRTHQSRAPEAGRWPDVLRGYQAVR